MQLSVLERLVLLNSVPKEGDITTMRIVRRLQDALSFSEEDHKKWSIQVNGSAVTWNTEVEQGAEIEVGEKAVDVIVTAFQGLDRQKKLTLTHLPVYERFLAEQESRK